MFYTLVGKLLNYACVPDPEHNKFTSTDAYAWEQVVTCTRTHARTHARTPGGRIRRSRPVLEEAGIQNGQDRAKLVRLLHRDGFNAIDDLHNMHRSVSA